MIDSSKVLQMYYRKDSVNGKDSVNKSFWVFRRGVLT